MQNLGEIVMIAWAQDGAFLEKNTETTEALTLYVSVPETSEYLSATGEQMAGEFLARRLKTTLIDMGIKRLVLKYRIRKGEHWTKAKGDEAATNMRKKLYGSQW